MIESNKFMKKISVFLTLLMIGIAPFGAIAQTSATSSQPTIQEMLAKIQELQTQIKQLQEQTQQMVVQLATTLRQGAQGDQVKILQAILAADQGIYPEGIISGFFGPLT